MTARTRERDPLSLALSRLTTYEPDSNRAARIRARGRVTLAARAGRQRRGRRTDAPGGWKAALEPLLVAGVCLAFLLEVFSRATRLYGF
jgi:hypothetical protein